MCYQPPLLPVWCCLLRQHQYQGVVMAHMHPAVMHTAHSNTISAEQCREDGCCHMTAFPPQGKHCCRASTDSCACVSACVSACVCVPACVCLCVGQLQLVPCQSYIDFWRWVSYHWILNESPAAAAPCAVYRWLLHPGLCHRAAAAPCAV